MPQADAGPDGGESAIIVPVEVPMGVRRLRDRMDHSAAVGVPAHITLLYPFMPPALLADGVRETIRQIVASEASFPLAFHRLGRWPDVVYLVPEPDTPFRRLTAALAEAFPQYPPYGGAHADVVPHLTVAQGPRADYLAAAEHALPGMLPIRDVCREVQVIAQPVGLPWNTIWRLPLTDAPGR